jgi:hypothetical protein
MDPAGTVTVRTVGGRWILGDSRAQNNINIINNNNNNKHSPILTRNSPVALSRGCIDLPAGEIVGVTATARTQFAHENNERERKN